LHYISISLLIRCAIVWINRLYASVSDSCESMIGYTADLGKCLYDARLFTCHTRVCMKVSNVWEFSSYGDDAVDRTMVQVVATIVHVSGVHVERVDSFTAFVHIIHTVRVWAEVDLLQVHNSTII
jgi:hypothetical protein